MRIINSENVIEKDDSAIVIFTRGGNTKLSHIGMSYTGEWTISDDRSFEKVIIYYRLDEDNKNMIFKGNYVRREPSSEKGRVVVYMTDVEKVGETESNWSEFSGNQNNPITYINC